MRYSEVTTWLCHKVCRVPTAMEISVTNRDCIVFNWEWIHGSELCASRCHTDNGVAERVEKRRFPNQESLSSCSLPCVRGQQWRAGNGKDPQISTPNEAFECVVASFLRIRWEKGDYNPSHQNKRSAGRISYESIKWGDAFMTPIHGTRMVTCMTYLPSMGARGSVTIPVSYCMVKYMDTSQPGINGHSTIMYRSICRIPRIGHHKWHGTSDIKVYDWTCNPWLNCQWTLIS